MRIKYKLSKRPDGSQQTPIDWVRYGERNHRRQYAKQRAEDLGAEDDKCRCAAPGKH